MKVTPIISADVDEYPELKRLLSMVIRPLVDIMGAHAIASVRRIHKVGVFDHPYDKDVVTPMGIPGVPEPVQAVQYAVGRSLLDYLSTIGIAGLTLEAGQDDLQGLMGLWQPESCPAAATPVSSVQPAQEPEKEPEPKAEQTGHTENTDQSAHVDATESKEDNTDGKQ